MQDKKDPIEVKFEKAFSQLGDTNPIFPFNAKMEMKQMVDEIVRRDKNIMNAAATKQGLGIKSGFVAEELHAESHNLDAILKGDKSRAFTDNDKQWYQQGFKKNDTPDIIVTEDGKVIHQTQVKYHKSSQSTSTSMSQVDKNTGKHKYGDMDSFVGPSDQINPQDGSPSISEKASELSKTAKNRGNKALEDSAKSVSEKNTDTVTAKKDGPSSKSYSKSDAEEVAKNPKAKPRQDIHDEYQTASTLKQMRSAAVGAAAISAISSGVINSMTYINKVRNGEMTETEAARAITVETVCSAADSAVKASATAGTHSMIIRYGSKELQKKIAAQGLKGMMRSNVVTVGVVCAVDAVKDLVRLGAGKITKEQFYERQGKGILNTSAGVTGGSVGMAVGTSFAGTMGLTAGSTGLIAMGFAGGLAGGIIAGLAMQIAIENHIEQAYKETVANTQNLKHSLKILEDVSVSVFQGQILFTKFLEDEFILNSGFDEQRLRLQVAGKNMRNSIDKL